MGIRWRLGVIAAGLLLALTAAYAWGAPVQRFTDSRGVINITNAPLADRAEAGTPAAPAAPRALTPPPGGEGTPASPQGRRAIVVPPADPSAGSGTQTEAESEAEPPESESSSAAQNIPQGRIAAPPGAPSAPVPESPQPPPAVRTVAWQESIPVRQAQVAARPHQTSGGPIYTYRDSRGVLCIRNVVFEEAHEPPPVKQAQRPVEKAAIRKVSAEATLNPEVQEGPSLPVIPASLSEAKPEPQPLPTAVTPQARLAPESFGDIRRFRDAKGVMIITNVGAEGQEVRPPPVSLASYPAAATSLAAPRGPGGFPAAGPAPPPNQEAPRIVASRDRKGKLVIRTEEPARSLAAASPPLQPAALEPIIIEAAQSYGLPAPLVAAMIKVESNFVPWAVSPKGAMGLMQLMPGTASDLGVRDPFCPRENVLAGCRYLRLLLNSLDNSLPLALAAYNAGLQRVAGAGFRVPSIKETQEFVTQVLERYYHAIKGRPRAFGL